MKPNTTRTPETTKPQLSIRAQVLFRDREGQISDVTHQNLFGLKKFAEDGTLALYILNQCRKRLELLFLAAEGRPHVDADLVRLAVDDLRTDMEEHSQLASYVQFTQELFTNSEALVPRHPSGTRTPSRALSITKPAS